MSYIQEPPESVTFVLEIGNVSKARQRTLTFWYHSITTLSHFCHFYGSVRRQNRKMCYNNHDTWLKWVTALQVRITRTPRSHPHPPVLSIYSYFLCFLFVLLLFFPVHPLHPVFSLTLSLSLGLHFAVLLSPSLPPCLSQSMVCSLESSVQGPINKPSHAYWEPMIAAQARGLIIPFLTPPSIVLSAVFVLFCLLCFLL